MQTHIRVYRVEHKSYNVGPYRLRGCNDKHIDSVRAKICNKHNFSDNHPSFWYDFPNINDEYYKMHCGFRDLKSLNYWFDGFQNLLGQAGFVIKVYRIKPNDFVFGQSCKQILFKKPICPVKILPIALDGCF